MAEAGFRTAGLERNTHPFDILERLFGLISQLTGAR
jgi:hypothetical protein